MEKETYLEINQEQFKAFLQTSSDKPVIMLNLLKFKNEVVETGLSGEASYKEYMRQATPFFKESKAEILFFGHPKHMLIGPKDETLWDKVLLIKYATLEGFLNMVQAKGYPSHLRAQALNDSRLIHCSGA